MSQLLDMPSGITSKFSSDPLKRDWNDFQHLATQGRYMVPKKFSDFQTQRSKLAAVKKQLFNPKLPTLRRMERDDVLCRLADEHSRHTTSLSEDDFQNFDSTRDDSYVEFFGLNWSDAGKVLLDSHDDALPLEAEPLPTFGARLKPGISQTDLRLSRNKLYRSPSLSCLSPSATITRPIKYSYRNYGNGIFDQPTIYTMWPRFHMNTKNSFDSINRMPMPSQMQDIFRSTSMHAGISNAPWKPAGPFRKNNEPKTAGV